MDDRRIWANTSSGRRWSWKRSFATTNAPSTFRYSSAFGALKWLNTPSWLGTESGLTTSCLSRCDDTQGYQSKTNRAWLRQRGIAATIPERDDQIAHRRKRPGRPIDFGDGQKLRYRGRNVVERSFNKLKQWRGIAMRSDKTARSYRAAISIATTPIWIKRRLDQHSLVVAIQITAAPPYERSYEVD